MSWMVPSVIATASCTSVLALVYSYLYIQYRERYIGIWALSWSIYFLRHALELWITVGQEAKVLLIGNQLSSLVSGLLLLWGTYTFLDRKMSRWWIYGAVAGGGWITVSILSDLSFLLITLPTFLFLGAIYVWTGLVFLRSRKIEGVGKHVAGWAFILWGIHKANFPFLRPLIWFAPWGYLIAAVLKLTIATGILLVYFQRTRKELARSEERYRRLAENAPDLIYRYRLAPAPGFEYVNPAATAVSGYTPEEHYADPDLGFKLVHPDDRPLFESLTQSRIIPGEPLVLRWIRRDGRVVWTEQRNVPVYDECGSLVALDGIARDITDRRLAEEKLRTAHQQLLEIIEFLPDATFVIDYNRRVIAWNRAIEEMTGVPKEEIIGKGDYTYSIPFYGNPRPLLVDFIISGNTDEQLPYEKIEKKGATLYAEIFAPSLLKGKGAILWAMATPLYDSAGNLVGAIESIRDITDRKQMKDQLKYLSLHDPLTKLYNRAYFEEEMRRMDGGRHHPAGIIMCDVDGLKLINDTLGHDAGDRLLLAAAKVISESFREGDMLARIGGDEFAVLLPNSPEPAVKSACRRIREALARYNSSNPEFPLSISVGSAVSSEASTSVNDLFKEADNNMYREKLHRSQSARSAIVQTLMKALEARDYITEGHADRLQNLVAYIAGSIGLPERSAADLRLLAQFHDIGKVGIPDRILFKPGRLTAEEFAEMKRHCEIGHRIAQSAPDLAPIADWILKHHEWWNGQGYPMGLKGEEIPLECRILSIADAYDAMTNDRPYRKAFSHEEAVAELKKCSGIQFDPHLVPKFIQILQK